MWFSWLTSVLDLRGWKCFCSWSVTKYLRRISIWLSQNLVRYQYNDHQLVLWWSLPLMIPEFNFILIWYNQQCHTHHQDAFPSSAVDNATACGEAAPADIFMKVFWSIRNLFNQKDEMKIIIKNWKVKKSYLKNPWIFFKLISSLSLNLSWPHISYRIAPLSKEKVAP